VARADQCQVDLENLMARIDSTGLVAIAGVP
jgi:ABC-type transporter Mla MlaB component